MRCVDARLLFDAFLNGELSSAMATELQAHRVKCADCRREFALLEVSGHVLRLNDDPVALADDFTDRLIACMDRPKSPWLLRLRWAGYVGAPVAAAAVVAMAFLGVFDGGGQRKVAGVSTSVEEVLGQPPLPQVLVDAPVNGMSGADERGRRSIARPDEAPDAMRAQAPTDWFQGVRTDVAGKQQRGEPLERALDLTILQLIDILEQAKRSPHGTAPLSTGDDAAKPAPRSDGVLPDLEGTYDGNADR